MEQSELDLVDEVVVVMAVVEQWLPVENDDIGQDIAVPATPFVQRNAGIEAKQGVEPRIEAEFSEGLVVGPVIRLERRCCS